MSTKLIVPAVAYKKKGDGKELYYGKGAYVVLCYAKFKKHSFTSMDYRRFQLNKTKMVRDLSGHFKNLVGWGYLEKNMINGVAYYRITKDGENALYKIGERNKKRMLKEIQKNSSIGGIKRAAQAAAETL